MSPQERATFVAMLRGHDSHGGRWEEVFGGFAADQIEADGEQVATLRAALTDTLNWLVGLARDQGPASRSAVLNSPRYLSARAALAQTEPKVTT